MGRRFIVEEVEEVKDLARQGGCLKFFIFFGLIIGCLWIWDTYNQDDITKHPEDIAKLDEYIAEIKETKTLYQFSKERFLEKLQHFRNTGDAESRDGASITTLHYACDFGHYELVKLLVKYGADVNIKGGVRSTPPLLWVRGNSPNAEKIREYLKSKGAAEQ